MMVTVFALHLPTKSNILAGFVKISYPSYGVGSQLVYRSWSDRLKHKTGQYCGRPIHQPDLISCLLEQTDGIYAACLTVKKDYLNVALRHQLICVDAGKDNIPDFVDVYMMTFIRRLIEYCVGDGFFLNSVSEGFLIDLQPMEKSTARSQNPLSAEKSKPQLEKKRLAKRAEMKSTDHF